MIKLVLAFLLCGSVLASDYNDGLEAMRARKYERAIDRFNKSMDKDVMKGVVTAAKVKEQLGKAQAGYLGEISSKIMESDKEKKYKDALSLVNKGLRVLPDNTKLNKQKTDYEEKIKDLEAKVKEGELLLDSKEWTAAYNYFQKLRPYEDTISSISSHYDKAKDEIIDGFVKQAEAYEKNYDFISAKKEYEKALAYEPKDKSLNKKIGITKQRITAQEMLAQGKALSDGGQKEKAFEVLKTAREKDKDNKEIELNMNIIKDDIARMWLDRAVGLESKGQYQDAYLMIRKAEDVKASNKDTVSGIETSKKSITLSFAKFLGDKAAKLKGNDEKAYIYYVASYALDSDDKDVQEGIKNTEQSLKEKLCYNLAVKTVSKVQIDKDTLASIDDMIKNEFGSFAKDKCINVTDGAKSDQGHLTNTILNYKLETKGATLTAKLDIEADAADYATKKILAKTRKMDLFAGEAAKANETTVEKDLINKVVRNLVSELKDSNIRYYGDRYYLLFNGAKDAETKTTNAVLTFIAKRRLSDDSLYAGNAVNYVLKTYGVNIDRKRIEITDKTRL